VIVRADSVEALLLHVLDPVDGDPGESWGYGRRVRGESGLPAGVEQRRAVPDPVAAGVLVPVVLEEDGSVSLMLTLRTDTVKDHKGQMSFPGGVAEEGDESLLVTALRETEEETGLSRERIRVVGRLKPYDTITGYRVHPFVGVIDGRPAVRPSEEEIEQVFFIGLEVLMDEGTFQESVVEWQGERYDVRAFEWGGPVIWGATANMLTELIGRMRGSG
jgi:8-oxo-dGTP pyrophosphatase MutT (NUDIX family)